MLDVILADWQNLSVPIFPPRIFVFLVFIYLFFRRLVTVLSESLLICGANSR